VRRTGPPDGSCISQVSRIFFRQKPFKFTGIAIFMANSSRPNTFRLLAFTVLTLVLAASCGQKPPAVAEQMAKTYGLDSFGQIEGIRYTWNAEFPGHEHPFDGGAGTLKLSQAWEWNPKTDTVSYEGPDKEGKPIKVTYQRSQLSSQSDAIKNQVDPAFVNDQYWLLFPLHAIWDRSATVTDEGTQKLPLGEGSAERVVVKYPSGGGYTPGDTWELYLDADKRVQEMVYRRGGPKKPSVVIVTWADYKKAGPLLISTDHRGTADGQPLRIFFSDVSVKVAGSQDWMNAQ